MEEFLEHYGYIALSVGTFFEGETAILVAASLAASGVFKIPYTILFGFLGSFVSDWLYFTVGRINGKVFTERRPKLMQKFGPVRKFFNSHRLQILFSYRFLYGFRVIIPLMLGMSDIKTIQFLGYSIVAGLIWASVVGTAGYFVGKVFSLGPASFENNLVLIIACFACFGLTVGFLVKRFAGRKMQLDAES